MPAKEDMIASTIKELELTRARLAAAETNGEKEEAGAAIKAMEADLKWLGHEAAAPAKRAETRPAPEAEKRGPGRPRAVTD
jgi:hypothetical protein